MSMRNILPLLLLASIGCGGVSTSAFHPSFPDNDATAVASVSSRLAARSVASERPVVVGVTNTSPRELFAIELPEGRLLFREAVSPIAVPIIAGNVVVVETEEEIIGLSLVDGETLFRESTSRSTGRAHLTGAGGEGDTVAFALGASEGGGDGKVFVYERGVRAFVSSVPHAVGAPTVAGGMVFVPWAYQNISVLDARTGAELARVRVTDTMVGHVFTAGEHVYIGQRGLFRFTPAITNGTRADAEHYAPPETGLSQAPELMRDAYRAAPAVDSALNRVRFVFRPSGSAEAGWLTDGALYLVYFRMVFGLDAATGETRWYADAGADVAGAAAREGGVVVMDTNGVVTTFDTRGLPVARHETGIATEVAVLRAASYAATPDENAAPLSRREQLIAAVRASDARLVPARRFALRALAAIADDDVTADLMGLCEDRRLPPLVKEDACAALARRPTGPAPILAGLARRASFLEGTTAPEVAALARAAGTMREPRAVPLLVEQLFEPTTTNDGIAAIAAALQAIGDASAAEPLLAFLRMYHADVEDFEMVASLKSVANAYAALAPAQAPAAFDQIASDASSDSGLAAHVAMLARTLRGSAQATTTASTRAATPATPEMPTHVTVQMVAEVLAPAHDDISRCLERDAATPRSARITIVLERTGVAREVAVIPASLEACIEPYVLTRRFPETRGRGTQNVTFTFRLAD